MVQTRAGASRNKSGASSSAPQPGAISLLQKGQVGTGHRRRSNTTTSSARRSTPAGRTTTSGRGGRGGRGSGRGGRGPTRLAEIKEGTRPAESGEETPVENTEQTDEILKEVECSYGDASNAFAEADAPSQRFHMRVDEIFNDWWVNHKGRTPIPRGYVLPVQKAMQGHPESPRLWDKLISGIIDDIGLKATAHKPCLYHGVIDGDEAILLRMVDDFAIGCKDEATANKIWDAIDNS